ncbi:hypothetical protein Tco_0247080 [Tanacetum coccineum]
MIDIIKNSTCYKAFTITAKVPEMFMQQFWYTIKKVSGVDFAEVPNDETTFTFLIDLGYKGLLHKHPSMYVDHMHQPWITLAAIINKCLSEKAASNDILRKFRIDILWGMFYKENEYRLPFPKTLLTEGIKLSESYQMFIKYSTGQITPKNSRGKGLQWKKTVDTSEVDVDVSEESDYEPARKQTSSRRVIKKKATITVDDNIIPEHDVALELGKSISLIEVIEKEAERQVHAIYERVMTVSDPEPVRRRPSSITFKDTSSVSKNLSTDPSQKLKGVQTLTVEEQLAADTMKALKERVPDESTVVPATSSEGTGDKAGVPDEEKVTKANVILDWGLEQESKYFEEGDDDENIKWVDTDEEEEKDDDDDEKSINFEKTDDEETNDEFMHNEEMTNAENADTRNGDEEITNTANVEAEKIEVEKDDIKKAELPLTSSSLSISLGFDPLHVVIQRESVLEKDVQELKEADNTTILHASLRSKIPSAINAYLRSSLGDALQKVLQKHTEELIKKYPQQVDYKEMIEESVQANIVNENAFDKTPLPVAQSSSQAQSSLKAAESLSKYKLKTIVFEKMDKSRSYQTHDKHQSLYDALLNSLILNDDIARGQANAKKVLRKRDRDEEDPSDGPNQGKKTKRRRTKEFESSKKSSTSKESSKGKSPDKTSKFDKSMTAEEPVEDLVFEMAFDDIEQTC